MRTLFCSATSKEIKQNDGNCNDEGQGPGRPPGGVGPDELRKRIPAGIAAERGIICRGFALGTSLWHIESLSPVVGKHNGVNFFEDEALFSPRQSLA